MVQAPVKPKNALHELGYKIFLDRYALKDMKRKTLQVGDLVIVVVNPQTGQREIGKVTALALPKVTIELLDGEVTERDIEHVDKPLETEPGQMMDRVAKGIATVEKNPKLRKQWAERFRWLLDDFKFVPAGRILAAAGTNQDLTFYNCMPPEQEILTADGYKPLGEVRVGDLVVTHHNRLRPVLNKFERETEEPIYVIKPRKLGFDDLRVTGDHKIHLIRYEWINKHRSRDGLRLSQQPDWIPAKDVRVGDFVAVAYNGEECPPEPIQVIDYLPEGVYQVREGKVYKATTRGAHGYVQEWGTHFDLSNMLELDEDLCYLMGRWLGDGCVNHRTKSDIPSGIKIVFALDEKAEADQIAEIITRKFGIPAVVKLSSTGRWYDLWANSMPLGQFFKAFLGAYSYGKRIPDVLMHMPKSLTIALLRGLFSADGYISRNQLGIVLSNRVMATQVHQLLVKLGYLFSIKENTHRLGKHPAYRIQATANECGALFQAFFDRPAPAVETDTKHYIEYGGLRWVRIDEIALVDYSGIVMDIEVAEDHSFVSAGVVVSNCYVISSPHDSRAGIIKTLSEMTEIMSRGGGVGINISSLRPRHSYVKGVNGRSSGSVSWGALYSFVTGLIEQGGSRRGALMLILNDWHPDVFDFINSKRQAGQITNANISVNVSDKLMAAIKADGDWELMFPDTGDPKYDSEWNGDLDGWRANGGKVIPYRTVKAREVWNAIIESAWASAEPGLWFGERSNKESNSSYFNPLICTNPCVTGDTRISTDRGLIQARELFDSEQNVNVVVDGRFGYTATTTPASRVILTGEKQVYRVQTREGYYVRATADHRIMTARGWVEVQDLHPGDRLHIVNRKGGFGTQGGIELGRVLGSEIAQNETVEMSAAIEMTSGGRAMARPYNQTADERRDAPWHVRADVPETVFQGSEDMQRGFLQALFTADGSFQDGGAKGASIRLAANSLTLLEQVQSLLLNFGIASHIYRNRRQAGYRQMPDANRELKAYWCEAQHELAISKRNMNVFADEIGFLMTYKQDKLEDYIGRGVRGTYSERFTATVESIVEDGIEEVFDLTEPLTHSFVGNNIVIHNCGEQSLGAYSVCNLGAINLAKFYDEDKHDVNWELLDTAVRYATRFLDNVIDATPYFFEENERVQKGERRVGLNNMGLAELLIKLELRYGSPESLPLIDKLYAFIARASYETSIELAQEKGAFPEFDGEKFIQSGFMQKMPADIRERTRKVGIRNVTLLTQAPTGTTGTMVNTSTGIEPFFSWKYYRKSRLGLHEENVPIAQEWLDAHPGETALPDYFATAMDLAPEDHARVQAAIQRWVDSSISKTSNLPNNYTVEQVGEFYELLYDLGCKGGTVYRDGSRSEQVLMLKGDERAESELKDNEKAKSAPAAQEQVATPHRVYPRPKKLTGVTVNTPTPYGTSYITMNSDENGYPFEVFITAPGKAGSDLQADAEGLGRMISLQLRTTAPQNRMTMLRLVIDQLQGIGGSRTVGFGPSRVLSLPDALAAALLEQYFSEEKVQQLDLFNAPALPVSLPAPAESNGTAATPSASNGNGHHNPNGAISGATLCPSCGTISLVRAEGCRKCLSCGYSEC